MWKRVPYFHTLLAHFLPHLGIFDEQLKLLQRRTVPLLGLLNGGVEVLLQRHGDGYNVVE